MKAAILTAVRRVALQEAPVPTISPTEVLIRVRAAGICGSEVHAFKGTHPFRKPPTQPGHEIAGDVTEVGSEVAGLAVGDRVAVLPGKFCGRCWACRHGFANLCVDKVAPGTGNWPGGFAEYFKAPQEACYLLPAHVSYEEGALVDPMTSGVHAIRQAGLSIGQSVAVLGAGTVGLGCVAAAREAGVAPIIATGRRDLILAAATRFGATRVVDSRHEDVIAAVRQATDGQGVDTALVAAGHSSVVEQAVAVTRPRGQVLVIALFESPLCLPDTFTMIRGERAVIGSWGYTPQEFKLTLDLIASGKLPASSIITHRLPLSEAQGALEMLADRRGDSIKVVLTPE